MEYGLYPRVASCNDEWPARCNEENYIDCTPQCFNEISVWMENDYMAYNCELMEYSRDYSTYYDVYAMRTVDAYGLNPWAEVFSGPTGSAKAMSYMRERLDPGKQLWVPTHTCPPVPGPVPRSRHTVPTICSKP